MPGTGAGSSESRRPMSRPAGDRPAGLSQPGSAGRTRAPSVTTRHGGARKASSLRRAPCSNERVADLDSAVDLAVGEIF